MSPPIPEAETRWNLTAGQSRFFPPGEAEALVPFLIELQPGITPREFAEKISTVQVPELYTDILPSLDPAFDGLRYITARVPVSTAGKPEELLRDFAQWNSLTVGASSSPPLSRRSYRDSSDWVPHGVTRPTGRPAASTVVVGIVDDGIAFAHERFRHKGGGSRFHYFWMQDGPAPGPHDVFGSKVNGRELHKHSSPPYQGIDDLLTQHTYAGLVDEDELYRAAGVVDPDIPRGHKAIQWRRAHGTHVLDTACSVPLGFDIDSRVVGVQLPVATTGLPVQSHLGTYLIEGLWYILVRSLSVSTELSCGPLPVAINVSYGLTTGPHDGTHIVERAIDFILPLWSKVFGVEVEIVIASGNAFLDRLHAEVSFRNPGERVDLPWRIQPDDGTPSLAEIWLPASPGGTASAVEIEVLAPDGRTTGPLVGSLNPLSNSRSIGSANAVVCDVVYDHFGPPTNRGRYLVFVQPSASLDPNDLTAPHGAWTISLKNISLPPDAVTHAYVAFDQAPYGYPPRGRQAYFDDPAYERYDEAGRLVEADNASMVKRDGNQNGIATGTVPSVVGGLLRKELVPAPYSAGGPTASATRYGPDALAVSDDSRVHAGVLAAGTRSGAAVAMNGTSVAAPMITRWIAGELASNRSGSRFALQTHAAGQEPLPPPAPPQPPPKRGGTGRMILQGSRRSRW